MKKIAAYYLKPYYFKMAQGFIIKFIGTIMDLCLPWILAYMIDTIIPLKEKKLICLWGIGMLCCSLLAVVFNIIANRMASKVARDTAEQLRHDLFEKIFYLSNHQIDEYTKPSLIARLTTDTYNIHQMIGRIQRLGVRAPILLLGGVLLTLTLDPMLTMILIAILPFITIVIVTVSRKSIPMYTSLQASVDQFVRLVREDIAGIRVIKALSKINYEKERFNHINLEVVQKEKKAGITMASINPLMNLMLNTGLVLVIAAGAYRVNSGSSQVGKILAFMTYFTIILNAMMSISKMFVIFSKAAASAERIDIILNTENDMRIEELPTKESSSFLEFDHVSFSYNKTEGNIKDLSFQIKKGETLGIIGETGAGKTTILHLLMRLYDVDSGAIYIDGINIKSMEIAKLREQFGVVFQNDTIFEDTIQENIRLGRKLTEKEIKQAVTYAQAKEFVEAEAHTYSEKLAIKGANLSGGQKQRILIARALAARPEILILDDSSSALDYKTDSRLRKEIREHFTETTTIIIAQRVSSVKYADHILVLENGKMIGYGTHEQLIENCEIYKEIAKSQMGENYTRKEELL